MNNKIKKFIFLDIDGVLITTKSIKEASSHEAFDKECVENLKELLEISGAEIVISSSWRYGKFFDKLLSKFKQHGIKMPLGTTKASKGDVRRDTEILDWFDTYIWTIQDWCVIDDDKPDLTQVQDKLIHTDFKNGFQKKHIKQALKILNCPII
ncbi:MAG: hypothetical protein GY870_05560 [archaeon]|nr:hypothetical protein [archaeon]